MLSLWNIVFDGLTRIEEICMKTVQSLQSSLGCICFFCCIFCFFSTIALNVPLVAAANTAAPVSEKVAQKNSGKMNPLQKTAESVKKTQEQAGRLYKAFVAIFKSIFLVLGLVVCIFWFVVCFVGLIIVISMDLVTLFQSGLTKSYFGFFMRSVDFMMQFLGSVIKY